VCTHILETWRRPRSAHTMTNPEYDDQCLDTKLLPDDNYTATV